MFAALSKAFAQWSDPAFRGVFLRALAASIVVFIVAWFAAWFVLGWTGDALSEWLVSGDPESFWGGVLDWLFGAVAVAGVLVASFLIFPAVTAVILSFLLEDVVMAVERRHYPGLPAARPQPIREALRNALAFAGVTIALNLLLMPIYLVLLFLPPFNLFVFYGLNGYLLGREYFELVAQRRLDPAQMRRLRGQFRGRVFMAGVVIAFLLSLPLVNLAIPIVATGFMVHLFEEMRRRQGAVPAT
ncbi:MAG: EI24 domain-containing protein [Rhodospirillales bacterium]|nr:EI24 domain-containing protein [Rhodospirillales bacterium]